MSAKLDSLYLNEYDHMYFKNEKYLYAGNGGKQRNKKDQNLNNKYDPCGNVRKVVEKIQNFEHKRHSGK